MGNVKITRKEVSDINCIKVENSSTGEYFLVYSEYGANLMDLNLKIDDRLVSVIESFKSTKDIKKEENFRSAVLIPFPNRIRNGIYNYNGREYRLQVDEKARDNAIHGFVYNKPFDLSYIENRDDEIEACFECYYNGDLEGYPFPFKANIIYKLLGHGNFECVISVENLSCEKIPIGVGWHPYLRLPSKIDDLYLSLPPVIMHELDEMKIPTGRRKNFDLFADPNPIGNLRMDSTFEIMNSGLEKAETRLIDKKNNISLEIWQDAGKGRYNYIQIFTSLDRQSIAVEPMTCNIDAFNNDMGLQILSPRDKLELTCGIKIRRWY